MAFNINTFTLSLLLLLLPLLSSISVASVHPELKDPSNQCVYTVYVRTGSIWKGGTDSIIGLTVNDTYGNSFTISDLVSWGGLMGPDNDYFERGDLDIFSGRGPCLASRPCAVLLYSDGSGPHHGWYCNYVEVTSTGPHMGCGQQQFTIEQWLATDVYPYQLSAARDYCHDDGARHASA